MSEILKSPLGIFEEHSKADLTQYASCVYQDIRAYGGDLKSWWTNNWLFYTKEVNFVHMHFTILEGGPHFWKRMRIKEEDDETVRQSKRIKQEEKEIIDLTQDETDDEENDNEDEDSEMGYETQEETEQGPEIIDLTKDYV